MLHRLDLAPFLVLTQCLFNFAQFNVLGQGANASIRGAQEAVSLSDTLPKGFNEAVIPVREPGAVGRLLHTQVGDGPRIIERVDGTGEPRADNGQTGLLQADGTPVRLMRTKK